MQDLKTVLRFQAYNARNAQIEKDRISQEICQKVVNSDAYQQAETVMWYVHCRSEGRTIPAITQALASDKQIVIPYCTRDEQNNKVLGLWLLKDMSELVIGTWGIQEPPRDRWQDKDRIVRPDELDLIIVPGVGFDSQGGRLGNGAGYYDRLLNMVRDDTILSALCYQCQVFTEIPMDTHDVYMDYVLTELNCYTAKGRN